ncbi:MAG: ferritin family protein [Elusimicrobia bacterium]|nr:ferritin family protein [Elusimicrobiota bacterium]
MNIFKVSEIVEFAIQIEKNGEQFYRESVKKISDEKIKSLFLTLADEEVKHKKIFEELLKKVEDYKPVEAYNDEYFAYLRAYAGDKVFNKKSVETKKITEVIQFALNIERDSILYYLEAKNYVQDDDKNILDKIIEEERKHFVRLSQLKV